MKPILAFSDHPNLEQGSLEALWFYDQVFYWSSAEGLERVIIRSLSYTNIGDPYRELARVTFTICSTMAIDSIDISTQDAAELYLYYYGDRIERPIVSDGLKQSKGFIEHINTRL